MKQKLLLLILALFTTMGAWADVTVTISDQTDLAAITDKTKSEAQTAHKYGDYNVSGTGSSTFTTNADSRAEGLVISTTANILKPTWYSNTSYLHCLAVKPADGYGTEYTITLSAPSGYYIKSYSMKAISTSSNGKFDVKFAGAASATEVQASQVTFSGNTASNRVSFTVVRKTGGSDNTTELCIPFFTVTLADIPTYDGSYASLSINNTTGPSVAQWGKSWTSTSTPAGLQLTCTANNMEISTTANLHSAGGQTYTLTAPVGYLIAGYTIGMYGSAAGSFITPSGYGAALVGTDSSNPTYVYVTGLSAISTTFTRTGTSTNGYAPTFIVYLKPSYEVTYKMPGTSQSDVVVEQFAGSAISAPSAWARDGVTFSCYTTYSDGVFSNPISTAPASAQTVYVDYTFSKSSLISASSSELSWYRLAAYSNSAYYDLYYNGTAPYPFKAQSAFDGSDGYFWAFTGNPIDGFTIYNKAAEGYTMYASGFGNGVAPYMDNANTSKWYMKLQDSYIGFECAGTNNANRFWNDHGGGASSLRFFSGITPLQYTHIDDVDFSVLYTNNIEPFIDNAGTGYFKISSSDAETLSGEYTTANSDSKITLSEYASLVSSLNSKISWPATGYYRVKSVSANKYMKAESASQLTVDATGTSASTIVYLNGSNGTYTMKMQGMNVFANSNSSASTLTSNDKTTYLKIPVEEDKVSPGKVTIGNGATATDYHCVSESNVQSIAMGSNTDDNTAAYWTFEEATSVTVAMHSDGAGKYYATFCAPFSYTVSGATAYTLEKSGNVLTPTEVVGAVSAGTPVLLEGTSSAAATLTISGTEYATSPLTNTDLTGTYTAIADFDGNTNYVLGTDGSKVGFYHWNSENLGANRAYIAGSGSGVKGYVLNFDDDATAIEMVNGQSSMVNGQPIYNLAGQRISKMQKGINIVNGKKILR
ncbi:MAG: hypothetical protein IKQ37_09205 [Bacteroidaceae bacterium]|nr:hypothetical protein [Bacteroidaceae bacterium]